jgi:hypothetical protein
MRRRTFGLSVGSLESLFLQSPPKVFLDKKLRSFATSGTKFDQNEEERASLESKLRGFKKPENIS